MNEEAPVVVPHKNLLTHVADVIDANRDAIMAMRSQAFVADMFCRGQQNIRNYDPLTGNTIFAENYGERQVVYNICRSNLVRAKSLLLSSPPKRDAKPISNDVFSVDRAQKHTILMDWAYHHHRIDQKAQLVADGLLKAGVYVASFFLDPSQGEPIGMSPSGTMLHSGRLVPTFDVADRWYFDSRARTMDEVQFACRQIVVPTEEAIRYYPEHAEKLRQLESNFIDSDFLENRVVNSTQLQDFGVRAARGKGRIVLTFYYGKPTDEYPSGCHAVLAGNSRTPSYVINDYGFNPYNEIPVVLWVQDVSAYTLLGNGTFFNDLIPLNIELNKRGNAELANSDLCGNPILAVPTPGGTSPADVTNDFGQTIPYDPLVGPPSYIAPPAMPNFHFEAKNFILEMSAQIAPSSPNDVSVAEKTSSGIHASLIQEEKRKSILPMMTNWENGWNDFWRMYVRLWKRLTILPQNLSASTSEGKTIRTVLSGADLGDDVEVWVVPSSSMPTSRTATFAEYVELIKVGVGRADTTLTPQFEQKMLQDIGRGDMTSTWRDFALDQKNADYIVMQLLSGEQVVPRIQDNPDVVINAILDFMKGEEYRNIMKTPMGPQVEFSFTRGYAMFAMFKAERDRQTMMSQAGMMASQQMIASAGQAFQQPGGGGQKNPMQAANQTFAPGAPMGGNMPQATKGQGQAPSPIRNPGGNPR